MGANHRARAVRRPLRGGLLTLWLTLAAGPAGAAITRDVGHVAVVEDVTGAVHNTEGFWGPDQTCRETAKLFYRCHADDYDVLVAFDTKVQTGIEGSIRNVQQGTPVKNDIGGIGYTTWNFTARYGSAGKLQHCVGMASLASIPDSPDGPATVLFGLPLGLTGVELLGHELGHKWLMGVSFDKADDGGVRTFLRGYENDAANLHYSYWANSHSVMYGNFITDKGNGSWEICGGERGYNELDQYLMGLRPAGEVPPMLVLSDGSGQGSPAVATPRGTCNLQQNLQRVDVTIDDVVRATGARTPAYPGAQRAWRVGFVLVTEPGIDATPAQVAKVEAYRTRFTSWFTTATGGRGTVDTHLGPLTCVLGDGGVDGGAPRDGGAKPPEDAGPPPHGGSDGGAGGAAVDGGLAPGADGGEGGAPTTDGGPTADGGVRSDGGARRDGGALSGVGASGCSCDTGAHGGAGALPWLGLGIALLALTRRRGGDPSA